MEYRIVVYYNDRTIFEIYQFKANTRKDGLSKPLQDNLWIAFKSKPEGGKVEIYKSDEDGNFN